LLQDEDDLLAPVLVDELEKLPGRLPVGVFGFKDENYEIRSGDEALRDFLVVFDDGIGAGSVHEGDVP
jgi:hypothetical protein